MGLGKTLQAIALMIYMKQNGMLEKPMLVVVPKGVQLRPCHYMFGGLLSTWQRELKRWAPLLDNTESMFFRVQKVKRRR